MGSRATDPAGDPCEGLDHVPDNPSCSREDFADWDAREKAATSLGDTMPAFAGSPFLQFVVNHMADAAGLLNGLLHGKNKAGNRLIGEMVQGRTLETGGADAKTSPGFTEIGKSLAGVNEDDGHFGSVAVSLADHLRRRAELFGGA